MSDLSPSGAEPLPPSAATRVRVTLMLARGEQILLAALPCADGTHEFALPSCELTDGESLRDRALGIAAAAVDGKLVNLMFQRIALVAGADGAGELVVGMYGEIIPGGADPLRGAPPEPRSTSWRFVHRNALPAPLEAATALALLACRERWLALDVDAQPLAAGFGLPDTRSALAEADQEPSAAVAFGWRAAVAGASVAAWFVAALVGMRQRLSSGAWGWGENSLYALLGCALFAGYWCEQRQAGKHSLVQLGRNATSGVVAMGFAWALSFTAAQIGDGDAARVVFWLGCLGAVFTALCWPKPRGAATWWLAGWGVALFVSISFTLPPLGDALYGHGGESADAASSGPPALDDD